MSQEARLAIIAGGIGAPPLGPSPHMTSRKYRDRLTETDISSLIGGIGSAVGQVLKGQGIKLALLYAPFEADNVRTVVEQVYGAGEHDDISTYECDITSPSSVEAAFTAIADDRKGFPSILINSAGYVNLSPLEDTPSEDILRHYMINLYGPTLTGQAFARAYIAANTQRSSGPGGRIVNLASQAAHVALDNHGAYCASSVARGHLSSRVPGRR